MEQQFLIRYAFIAGTRVGQDVCYATAASAIDAIGWAYMHCRLHHGKLAYMHVSQVVDMDTHQEVPIYDP